MERQNAPYDCLIVGAGPAGLTAAIYLARYRRMALAIDAGQSRCAWVPRSHNHPGYPNGIPGKELLDNMRQQADRYGARIEHGNVSQLKRSHEGLFLAEIEGNGGLEARTVILATGVVDRQPDIPNLYRAIQDGLIRVCPVCDGYEVIGKRIAILGSNHHALGEALFMRTYTPHITVVADNSLSISDECRDKLNSAGVVIAPVLATDLKCQGPDIIVFFKDGSIRPFDVVYSALGTIPRGHLAEQLGARMSDDGRLLTDAHQQTSIPDLYAAGDIVSGLNQISIAMGQAAVAATAIHNGLRAQDRMVL